MASAIVSGTRGNSQDRSSALLKTLDLQRRTGLKICYNSMQFMINVISPFRIFLKKSKRFNRVLLMQVHVNT